MEDDTIICEICGAEYPETGEQAIFTHFGDGLNSFEKHVHMCAKCGAAIGEAIAANKEVFTISKA